MPLHPSRRRAVVIGGSIGGLFAALLLRQHGWDVMIFERSAQPLSGRGAGIVTHPALWRVMDQLGIPAASRDGVNVETRITLGPNGDIIGRCPYPQTMTTWDQVFGVLLKQWGDGHYALGAELTGVEHNARSVHARFEDGRTIEADLLVAADGFRSKVRACCLGEQDLLYAGYVGWRGMVAEADIPAPVHHDLFGVFGFGLPKGEQFIGYPVPGAGQDLRPWHRRYNFVWYRPTDEQIALPDLLTDASGQMHAMSIPPPLIRPEFTERLRHDASRLLAPQFAAIVHQAASPFLQPIYDYETPSMGLDHVAFLGDAAFVARPHVGAGVTKAAEDAWALAQALDGQPNIPDALASYQAQRAPAGQRIVKRARHLGAYMQARLADDEQKAAALRHHSPEAVMAETATLDF